MTPTDTLTHEEWLTYRRLGLGGSDAASVLGISPFRTGVDLYHDKLGHPVDNSEDNWVAMEMGNLLEDLVSRIFAKKTGLKVCPMKFMFQHPDYPWMLADIDRLVTLPDGSTAILEIKTTNYNARDKWEYNGKPIVPQYYEVQGRHYMAVLDVARVYYCCLYGNNEDEVIIRSIDRDRDYESELIFLEESFWVNHIEKRYSPHTMRHTCAMHMLEAGVPMMAIKNFLGHASVTTTERYAELTQSTVERQIKAWNQRWFGEIARVEANTISSKSVLPEFLK